MTFSDLTPTTSMKQTVSRRSGALSQITTSSLLARREMLIGVGALSACGVIFTLGCENEQTAHAQQRPLVALLLATLQEERYQKDKRFFEAKARELGLRPFTL